VPIRHVKEAEMVQALLEEVERFAEDTPALKPHLEKPAKKSALTVLG
jgi:(E)-4-hydroxy-3-methylbut-2-enyl-diphosphate synthase